MHVQMVRSWPSSSWERSVPTVDGALEACCQDAQSSTRETGRAAFAAYAAVLPSPAFEFLSRLDAGLQTRLRQALHSSAAREDLTAGMAASVLMPGSWA